MEIGPITAVRPPPAVSPTRSIPDPQAVFSIEFKTQDQDETYSPSQQDAEPDDESADHPLVSAANAISSEAGNSEAGDLIEEEPLRQTDSSLDAPTTISVFA